MRCAWASGGKTIRPPPTHGARQSCINAFTQLIAATFDDADAKRLIKRLRRHRGELLTFLDHEGVSPYNNHAEQQVGVAVHTRKVSQQNRSLEGAKTHAILLSLFRTAQLQGLNPVEHVMQLAQAIISGESTDTSAPPQLKKAA
jgi:transposase